MVDTTTPTTPPAQDLQINLDTNEQNEVLPQDDNTPKTENIELNLDLDLNLPDAPKDDDRLKTEDKKNNEVIKQNEDIPENNIANTPSEEPTIIQPVIEQLFQETPTTETDVAVIAEPEPVTTEPITEPVIETVQEIPIVEQATIPVMPIPNDVRDEEVKEETKEEEIRPSIMTEEVVAPIIATTDLNNDMKIIEEMEWHESAGGMAPEAMIDNQQIAVEQTPKTFDLDAMLGSPSLASVAVVQEIEPQNIPTQTAPEIPTSIPQVEVAPTIVPPVFTIPTTSASTVSEQTTTQKLYTPIPHKKNMTIKIVLFLLMFIVLGATTFFILKTMYPLEFANIFGGEQTQTEEVLPIEEFTWSEITWSEILPTEMTGTELSGLDMTGTIENETDTHGSATGEDVFWALDDLWVEPEPEQPIQNDVSRLTDYATQGNQFVEQGKKLTNNTMIKYGLFISKKSTTFLEDIANGKEINNLNGYFAQFDEYLVQLKKLAEQTTDSISIQEWVSPTPLTNDIQSMTTETGTSQDTWIAPE